MSRDLIDLGRTKPGRSRVVRHQEVVGRDVLELGEQLARFPSPTAAVSCSGIAVRAFAVPPLPSQLARSAGRSGRLDRNRTGKSRSARSLSASWIRFTNENVRHVKRAEHVRFPGNGHAPVWRHVSYPGTSTRSSPLPPMPGCFSPAVSDCCMVQPIPLFRARWPWRQSPRLSSPTPPPWSCPSSGARGEDRCPPADASKGHQTWCSCMARERRCSTRISACSRSSQRRSSREARLSRS